MNPEMTNRDRDHWEVWHTGEKVYKDVVRKQNGRQSNVQACDIAIKSTFLFIPESFTY